MPDYTVEDTVYKRFTTRAFATGIPTTLAGTPVVSAYEDDSTTQITAGITLGVDHDSVQGLNLLTIVATSANGYEAGKSYDLVITTGTVGGVSVVGEVVWHFTLSAEAAAVDLANGTDGLGAIKTDTAAILVDTSTTLQAELDAIQAAVITNAAGADIAADIIAVKAETAAILVDTAEIGAAGAGLTAIPWNAAWDAEVESEVNDALIALNLDHLMAVAVVGTDVVDNSVIARLAASGATADWDTFVNTTDSLQAIRDTEPLGTAMRGTDSAALASVATESRLAELDAANLPADIDAILTDTGTTIPGVLGTPAGASMSADIAAIKAETALIVGDTGELQTDWANGGRLDLILDARAAEATVAALNNLSAAQVNAEMVDVITVDAIAELAQAAPAATPTVATALMLPYMALRNKLDTDATTLEIHNNAGTVIAKKTLSDDGTTYSEAEMAAGP